MNLNEKFSQNIFLDWIDELLPDFERDVKKVDVPKSFTDVSKIESLGKSSIGVMVFAIQMDSDPTRRRVSITKDSFNLLKNYSVQNAIIAYFCPSFGQWRLSLLTSTATWEDGRVISKLSNLKRQSFVLGVNAKTKTPTKYLAGKVTDLADLKKRFSIEVVNKDFYKEISSAFNSLQSVLQLPSKEAKSQTNLEFSVRLIGRIIFCWFLREKRSEAGISLISDKVLSLDAVKNTKDYYHKLLEPLFFEVLNKPLESRNFDEFDKKPFTQTPYLNGGLFSAQYDDYYDRGRNDFQSKYHNTLVIPNSWFESLFETLETYHFTIDENTSYDEELSIDPEMLGRIFENLLAEINPETGESARKSTGSYYTPRAIVDYMVDESLTLYLKNKTSIDEEKIRAVISYDLDDDQTKPLTQTEKENIIDALGKLKILDPACGSGAFPMGALQKIVFILQQIDPNAEVMHSMDLKQTPPEFRRHIQEEFSAGNYDYLRKLRVIRESIYGVDIQPIATEISRLRCFLTLVVDQAIKDDKPDRGIKPLPNLDFKFVTANTLIGLPKNENGVQQMGIYDNREKIERLKEIIDDYFNSSGIERAQLKEKFANEQKALLREMEKEHGWSNIQKAELSNKLIDWEPFSHKAAEWFDLEWMFGIKEGFDIVIANPPYIQIQKFSKNIAQADLERQNFSTYSKTADLYCLFYEKGFQLLKQNGLLVYISSNKWMRSKYGEKLRSFFLDQTNPIYLVDYGSFQNFGNATTYTCIFIAEKDKNKNLFKACKITSDYNNESEIYNYCKKRSTPMLISGISNWIVLDNTEISIKNKIEKIGIPLKKWRVRINYGIKTGCNEAFVVDEDTKNKLVSQNANIKKILKPILRGKDIYKYGCKFARQYLIFTGYDIDIRSEYPEIIEYLNNVGRSKIAGSKGKGLFDREDQGKNWWNLRACDYYPEFDKEKIIWKQLAVERSFYYDKKGYYGLNSTAFITGSNLKYLIALLNSKLIAFAYEKFYATGNMQNDTVVYWVEFIKNLPLPPESNKIQELENIVNTINEKRDLDIKADISKEETNIDKIIYDLYGLSEEEINTVEKAVR